MTSCGRAEGVGENTSSLTYLSHIQWFRAISLTHCLFLLIFKNRRIAGFLIPYKNLLDFLYHATYSVYRILYEEQ